MNDRTTTTRAGARRRWSAATRSVGGVVTANATALRTPVRPLASTVQAAVTPVLLTVSGPNAESGPEATNGRARANTTTGSATTRRAAR